MAGAPMVVPASAIGWVVKEPEVASVLVVGRANVRIEGRSVQSECP